MKFQKNSVSKLALTDLLRRKRTNLVKYLTDNGIYSYELLSTRCLSIGVIAPTEEQFLKARGTGHLCAVSSPCEGIVVLYPAYEPAFDIQEESKNTEEDSIQQFVVNNDNFIVHEQETIKTKRKKKIINNED